MSAYDPMIIDGHVLDIAVREIALGVWWVSAFFLACGFLWYGVKKIRYSWGQERDIALTALFLSAVFGGSSLRVALQWQEFLDVARGHPFIPAPTWPWLAASVALSVIGAAGCFYYFSPLRYRWPITIGCLAVSLAVPLWAWVYL
jgi:hypothetical protein